MDNETSKKTKVLLDLAEKLSAIETNRNFEHNIMAGRVNPTPSFSLNPKVIVKPKKDEDKQTNSLSLYWLSEEEIEIVENS